MAPQEDRGIQRTRQLLRESLLALVKEKEFEILSVQEIADRAGVGRTTFYAHFSDKEEPLLYDFDELRVLLRQRQREARARQDRRSERLFGFSRELFEHVNDHRDVFQAMVGKRSGTAVQHHIQGLVVELVREEVKLVLPPSRARATQREPLVPFIAGALFGLLGWRLDEKTHLSRKDMDRTFSQLAIPATNAAAPTP